MDESVQIGYYIVVQIVYYFGRKYSAGFFDWLNIGATIRLFELFLHKRVLHFVIIFGNIFHETINFYSLLTHQFAQSLFKLQRYCIYIAASLTLQSFHIIVKIVIFILEFGP